MSIDMPIEERAQIKTKILFNEQFLLDYYFYLHWNGPFSLRLMDSTRLHYGIFVQSILVFIPKGFSCITNLLWILFSITQLVWIIVVRDPCPLQFVRVIKPAQQTKQTKKKNDPHMKIEHTYPFFHQHKHSPRKIENSNKMFALLLSSFLVSSKYFHAMNRFQFYELFG